VSDVIVPGQGQRYVPGVVKVAGPDSEYDPVRPVQIDLLNRGNGSVPWKFESLDRLGAPLNVIGKPDGKAELNWPAPDSSSQVHIAIGAVASVLRR
jgi:hypothetical protein